VHKAYKGSTSYTFDKRIRLAANHIFSTTFKPLLFPVYTGVLCLIVALFQLPVVLYQPLGQEWLVFSLWLIGGTILVSLGLLGVYLTRVLVEVRQRPLTIIKNIYRSGE
jgi:putative glycosyltransferase